MKPEDLSVEELEQLLVKKKLGADQAEADASEKSFVSENFVVDRPDGKSKGKSPVKAKENTWLDDGSEFSDVTTPIADLTPRARPKPKKVEKECHVCGKKFKIHASLVSGEFLRCNRCTGR